MSAPRRQGWVGPIEWMARNSIAANLLMILLLGGGLWMAVQVQKEIFPEAQLDVVEVEVTYPGAAPEEVEQGVLCRWKRRCRASRASRRWCPRPARAAA